MTPTSSNPEEGIDKVLKGLQATEAPLGLEHRVLARVRAEQGRQATAASSPFRWLSLPHRTSARTLLAGVVAVIVLGCAVARIAHRHQPATTQAREAHPQGAPTAHPLETNIAAPVALALHGPQAQPTFRTHARRAALPHTERAEPAALPAAGSPVSAQALTVQEELLAHIAHSGAPAQRAALNPDVRAQLEANDDAEFRRFMQASNEPHNP